MKDVCIVIPVYKTKPSLNELRSIEQCKKVMKGRDIAYVAPEGFDSSAYPTARVVTFNKGFFKSLWNYSELCATKSLYLAFADYDYIMIYQPDCWVFKDELDEFMLLGYDYIGAPWFGCKNVADGSRIKDGTVGNGGLSLRKVSTFIALAKSAECRPHPEDVYWCIHRAKELNIAPVQVAASFSIEHRPKTVISLFKGWLPMGCHKPWQLGYYEFWRHYGVPEYIDERKVEKQE